MSVQPPDQPVDRPWTVNDFQEIIESEDPHDAAEILFGEIERLRSEVDEQSQLLDQVNALWDDAVSALRLARQNALKEAANEVHIEARWQTEQQMRGMFANGERSIDRLMMLERILLDQARAVGVADETPEGPQT